MKKAGYITFGAVLGALAVVVMLVSYFPYLTYAIPALASLFIMVAVIEMGTKWALFSYVTAAVLTLLLAEHEAALLFVCFFGYYPIIKLPIERIKNIILRYILKLAVFNTAVVLVYSIAMKLMGIDDGFGGYTQYMIYAVWALANGVFVLYDYEIVRLSQWYIERLHSRVSRFLRK